MCAAAEDAEHEGILFSDAHWSGWSAGGVPGWVRIQTNRHGQWLWDLSTDEAATFGPTIKRVSDAIRVVCEAETVYLIGLGENSQHAHVLLVPRRSDAPPEARGLGVLGNAVDLADPKGAMLTAARIRELLS